eukprot:900743-Prymnesium_polylepis.2
MARDELGGEGGGGRLLQHVTPRARLLLVQVHRQLVQSLDRELRRLAERLDDDLRVDALLNVGLGLAQELAGEEHDAGRAVAHLRVLRH